MHLSFSIRVILFYSQFVHHVLSKRFLVLVMWFWWWWCWYCMCVLRFVLWVQTNLVYWERKKHAEQKIAKERSLIYPFRFLLHIISVQNAHSFRMLCALMHTRTHMQLIHLKQEYEEIHTDFLVYSARITHKITKNFSAIFDYVYKMSDQRSKFDCKITQNETRGKFTRFWGTAKIVNAYCSC